MSQDPTPSTPGRTGTLDGAPDGADDGELDGALAFAVDLVTRCGEEAARRQAGVTELAKPAGSLAGAAVTEVDLAVEREVDAALARAHPGDGLLGEEEVDRPSSTGRTWVVDPIDGTLNYARRLGPWSVVLSAWDGDAPLLVAVWTAGVVYTATTGGGAFRDGDRLRLDPDADVSGGIVRVPPQLAAAAAADGWLVRSTESSAAEVASIADGRVVGTVRGGGHRRDLHGPALLVTEAGGTVTGKDGGPWDGATRGLVVCAPGAHARLLGLVPR